MRDTQYNYLTSTTGTMLMIIILILNLLQFWWSLQAVIENVPLKQKIFSEIEKVCPPHCILATNTSTIDLNIIGQNTISKDRIIGPTFSGMKPCMANFCIVVTNRENMTPPKDQDIHTILKIEYNNVKRNVILYTCS